ncbi:MAG: protease complex subunit PrcB family protein, partial [Candidatus Hadarchaeum sp.]
MLRISKLTAFLASIVVLAGMGGLVGCAGSDVSSPIASDLTSAATVSPSGNGLVLGYFQFVFGDDGTVWVEETEPVRGAEINVTKFASIVIENFFFNEEERNWYITATIKNISPYTGYDVLAVFHSLGNKFVWNQDGYLWALPPIFPEPTRCAFIAYGKNQPDRVFPPMFQDTRTIIIHQPEGIPKLAPLGFWIEAWAKPRKFPGVEDLKVVPSPKEIYPPEYILTGYVWDHQSPSKDLTVWADCTNFNGQAYVPMYDDGNHEDGAAGDNIFGCTFSGDPEDGLYVITVYAFDPQGNQGENDARFKHGMPCDEPIQHLPFVTVDKGEHSGIKYPSERVINDQDAWLETWGEHSGIWYPAPPAPIINFEKHTVIGVWIGDRPSNNHMVTITDIQFDPCEKLVTVFYDYTPNIPCGPLDVITDPFHIVMLPKINWPVYFVGKEVNCPPPPPECVDDLLFETLIQGGQSGIHAPYELVITNQGQFNALWKEHVKNMVPPPPAPSIDWKNRNVVAVGLGDRPSSGFECIIEEVCILTTQQLGVFYKERIPGPDCPVLDVITQPHHWVVIPKVQTQPPAMFFKHTEVYHCGPPDCQEPQMFWVIDEGPQTGHPAGEFVIKDKKTWETFWGSHKPGTIPPSVNFKEDMVLAMLIGERPSTGYFVTTKEVCLNHNPDGTLRMDVRYVEHQPGKNCKVFWVLTYPFQIVVTPRFDGPVFFHHEVEVYECPDECAPMVFEPIEDGQHGCDEPGAYGFKGFSDSQFKTHWWKVHCWGPDDPGYMPSVPPAEPGYEWVPFEVQLPGRPSTGYYLVVDDVCIKGCDVYVTYTEYIPGPNCEVLWITTKPWGFWRAQLPVVDCQFVWHFEKHEVVYDCEPCNPVPFWKLAEGDQSCAEPGEYGWQYVEGYKQFWKDVHCGEMPPLPPDPEPIQGGIIYHFGIQLSERPTTGYYIVIDKA